MHVHFHPGDWVEVRPLPEILATLDESGKFEGLPFMPEMASYCGRRFQVYRRAEKVFLDKRNTVVRLRNTVFLEGVRCDGQSHGGCELGCLLFWKDAWLQPAKPSHVAQAPVALPASNTLVFPTMKENRFFCQATELVHCGTDLPWWDFRQYLRDYRGRQLSIGELTGMLGLLTCNKLRRVCGLAEVGVVKGQLSKTTNTALNLQPGELVQVKSQKEIEATLDTLGRNRGLGFDPEMVHFCGGTYRVLRRIDHMIVEWSAEMRQITNTVILDGVTCSGMARRCCPRDCDHLWREAWLRRDSGSRPPRRRSSSNSVLRIPSVGVCESF